MAQLYFRAQAVTAMVAEWMRYSLSGSSDPSTTNVPISMPSKPDLSWQGFI